jgi:Flp pilus assembly protein TadD
MKRLASILLMAFAVPAMGDIVHLNDGSSIEGTVKRTREGYLVTDSAGKTTTVPMDAVKSFELKSSNAPGGGADDRLGSLRRAVGNLDDIKQIIERYKAFVAQTKGTPVGKEAEQDLAQWQDRLDKKMVRAGKDWVTAEQFTKLQATARDAAAKAAPLVAQGKLKEGLAVVDQALAVSPASGDLLYLKGVILDRQSQTVPARNAYQGAASAMPDHGPSHNNAAVILWKTRQLMPAMLEFDKAMLAAPQSQIVLDNVSEALHALPDEFRKNDLTKRVVQHFNTQDAALQRDMAQRGLYRWGSGWLDTQQYTTLQAQQKAVKDKLDAMQKDFEANNAKIVQNQRAIVEDQNTMNLIQQQSIGADVNGNIMQFPLPQRYFDIQREMGMLQNEILTKQQQQVDLSRQANDEKKHMPEPRYTGLLKPFDLEGMPSAARTAPVAAAPSAGAPAGGTPAKAASAVGPGHPPQPPTTRRGGADY